MLAVALVVASLALAAAVVYLAQTLERSIKAMTESVVGYYADQRPQALDLEALVKEMYADDTTEYVLETELP